MIKNFMGRFEACVKSLVLLLASFWISSVAAGQEAPRTYPSWWWVGMKNPRLQLMIRAEGISSRVASIGLHYPGLRLVKLIRVENPNYLFLDLEIGTDARPGTLELICRDKDGGSKKIPFLLKPRRPGNGTAFARGVTAADFVYFLMPDRFSNGDPANDRIAGMRDQSLNRDSIFLRHGGDFQGIINHLDYFQGLGVTTLWLTPVLENDMPNRTEHGYAFTDHYTIEPRFGGAAGYHALIDALHERGMKIIQDAVYNHVGLYHFLVQDLPAKDWLHQWPRFTQTSYKDQPLMDPYASEMDKKITADGWFTREMPDINQSNPLVANFLIQHAIWCVEEFGIDGWRIDTYIYCDLDFMNRCNTALIREYPRITMFGEAWVHGTANEAYFAENNIHTPFRSNLQGIIDFQCNFYGIIPALTQDFGWTEGVNRLYNTLSNDFLYKDPMRNLIFLDNHDMSRFYSVVGEDLAKQKMGIEWLLTCRGIPQLYYGTEILMKGFANPDGKVRLDFPGGWPGDAKNAFTGLGLTDAEKEVQELVSKLGNFRKNSPALGSGKLMQYVPVSGLYVYFRYDARQTIMCVMNTAKTEQVLDFGRYAERTGGFEKARNVVSQEVTPLHPDSKIPPMTLWVLELLK
jgi:glycosidase